MKKILYDNWIARTFLWGDYDTITLAAWVCTKYKNKEEMPQRIRNHECTHARQLVECMIASGVIILALVIFRNIFLVVLPFLSHVLRTLCAGISRKAHVFWQ